MRTFSPIVLGAFVASILPLASGLFVSPASAEKIKKRLTGPASTEPLRADGSYVLSAAEEKLDCKKLTGTMQVRILQLRDGDKIGPGSTAAQLMQGAAAPIFGGTTYGSSPAAERARDLAMLDAYNKRLVEKGCPSYDLKSAMSGTETPRPTVPGSKGKIKKAKPAASAPAATKQ